MLCFFTAILKNTRLIGLFIQIFEREVICPETDILHFMSLPLFFSSESLETFSFTDISRSIFRMSIRSQVIYMFPTSTRNHKRTSRLYRFSVSSRRLLSIGRSFFHLSRLPVLPFSPSSLPLLLALRLSDIVAVPLSAVNTRRASCCMYVLPPEEENKQHARRLSSVHYRHRVVRMLRSETAKRE